MKKYLNQPVINLNQQTYLGLLIILMPILNFLGGINVDIYAPSMPSIASYFNVSILAVKNTISATVFGWVFGALFFGALIDSIGRKRTLIYGMSLYLLATVFSLFCQSIDQLMIIRFLQGFAIVSITVGCRALIIDTVSGHRYNVAIVYTTIGYGLGPVIGPFIGGFLQHYIGWHANFVALFVLDFVLMLIVILFVKESIPQRRSLVVSDVIQSYMKVCSHKKFIYGVFILGLTQVQMLLYPTIGPFIVQERLGHSVLVYGNTALLVGAGYLAGNLINKSLLKHVSQKMACCLGYGVLTTGVVLSYCFATFSTIGLVTVLTPIILVNISSGLIFSNVMGSNLKQFPGHAGIAMAVQISLLALVAAIGIFVATHVHVTTLWPLSFVYSVLAVLAVVIFFTGYCSLLESNSSDNLGQISPHES